MRKALPVLTVLALLAAFPEEIASARAESPISTGLFSNLALRGYDAVAYFTDGMPVEGRRDLSLDYQGATWRFATREHLEAFRASPESYAPQYGGYCAWAMAQGDFAPSDPKRWRIVDGKLYLNYNQEIQERWEKDIPGFIRRANAYWPEILDR